MNESKFDAIKLRELAVQVPPSWYCGEGICEKCGDEKPARGEPYSCQVETIENLLRRAVEMGIVNVG